MSASRWGNPLRWESSLLHATLTRHFSLAAHTIGWLVASLLLVGGFVELESRGIRLEPRILRPALDKSDDFTYLIKILSFDARGTWGGLLALLIAYGALCGRKARLSDGICIALAAAEAALLTYFLKILCSRPAPLIAVRDHVNDGIYGFHGFHVSLEYTSFPSGHAAIIVAMATSIFFRSRIFGAAPLALAVLISWFRVYLGEHYWSDVIGGVIIGCYFGWLSAATFQVSTNSDTVAPPHSLQ